LLIRNLKHRLPLRLKWVEQLVQLDAFQRSERCADPPLRYLGARGMIGFNTGIRVYLACGVTDMRKGIAEPAALAKTELRQRPANGTVFAFRGQYGDRIKLLYYDSQFFTFTIKSSPRAIFPCLLL
jgi:transposase